MTRSSHASAEVAALRVLEPSPCIVWIALQPGQELVALRLRPGARRLALGLATGARSIAAGLADRLGAALAAAQSSNAREAVSVSALSLFEAVEARDHLALRAAAAFESRPPPGTVAEVALAMGVSTRYLERAFAECVGLSPRLLRRALRVRDAAVALARGESAKRVAQSCGYADAAHLSREFRALVGVPPSAFRPPAYMLRAGGDEDRSALRPARRG